MHATSFVRLSLLVTATLVGGCEDGRRSEVIVSIGDHSMNPQGPGVFGRTDSGSDATTTPIDSRASRDPDRSPDSRDQGVGSGAIPSDGSVDPAMSRSDGGSADSQQPRTEATHFAPVFQRWSVPMSGLDDGFYAPWSAMGTRWFSTLDLTGDGLPDLVQTGDSSRENGFVWTDDTGSFWKVWPGENGGFSGQYRRWSVPSSGQGDGFFATGWSQGTRWFSTRDLNGDGRPDLIQTGDSSRQGGFVWRDDDGPHWRVWLGVDGGFSADPLRWSVPENGLDDGFFALYWADGQRWFSTIDLTGDGILDLVQTADSSRDGGYVLSDDDGTFWRVWPGQATGFSPNALRWSVPDSGLSDGFFYTAWTLGERCFTTLDLTGDGLVDLVQTADSARQGGYVWRDDRGSFWKVWPGDGRGFAGEHRRWAVPESGLDDGFFAPWWSQGERGFATMDLTGDGQPELIQTADPHVDGGFVWRDDIGHFWRVWVGQPNGFAPQSVRWAVPESGLDDGFFLPSWSMGQRVFTTMDLNSDGRPDLVQTADTVREGGFVWRDDRGPFWKVWLSR
jgi:DNA/RNA-binding domain of Phe-tRNA-synthetase-like protein